MTFSLKSVEGRTLDFVDFFKNERLDKHKPRFEELEVNCQGKVSEEKLYYLFLVTHFDKDTSANTFYSAMNWQQVQKKDKSGIAKSCKRIMENGKITIGGHRKHFNCLRTLEEKIEWTATTIASYKDVIGKSESQEKFFEIGRNANFDDLYKKMEEIHSFKKRLPRFDHLERVSRTHHIYVAPERIYSEDSSGPQDGITYIFFEKRLRKLHGKKLAHFNKYLTQSFPKEWNKIINNKKYMIPSTAKKKEIIIILERWLRDRVGKLFPNNDKTFIFDLESALCNYQKEKKSRDTC